MEIESYLIYSVLVCENCKRTFGGERPILEADFHAEQFDHVVSGTIQHRVTYGKTGQNQVD